MEIVNDKLPEIKNIIENVQEKVHTAMNKLEKDLENIEKVLDSYDIKLETRKTNEQLENNLEMFNEQWNRLSGEIDEILENLLKREEFENNIKQINLKVKDVEQHVESVQREIRNLNDKLVEKEKDLAVMQEEVQKKIDKKKKAIEYYSKFLGLEFRKIKENSILFIFKYINKEDPEERYICEINVDGNKYKILDCCPIIPTISQLEKEVNETNDFHVFVHNIRREFCAIANDTSKNSEGASSKPEDESKM